MSTRTLSYTERIERKRARDRAYQAKRRADKKLAKLGFAPKAKPVFAPKPQVPNIVRVALVLDESGSMNSLRDTVITQINRQLENLRKVARETGQETYVSVYAFSNRGRLKNLARQLRVEDVPLLSRLTYIPGGQTALLDAIKDVATELGQKDDGLRTTSFLLLAITDGQENDSTTGQYEIQRIISTNQATDRWTFALLVPPGGRTYVRALGIPEGNIQEWETTQVGFERASNDIVLSASAYYQGQTKGLRSTKSFFTTDLSSIGKTDLRKLDDLTSDFKHWQVKQEADIRSFVEAHGVTYQVGKAFYQLTKPEKVQYHKDFVLQDKSTKVIYGGDQARNLVGIGKTTDTVKVNPGNHANYNLFVQSTSTNRRLVRGTTLLYKVR